MAVKALQYPTVLDDDSSLFLAVNNVSSTLTTSLDLVATTVVVADASTLPAAGFVSVDYEIIYYESKSGNNLINCVRGADGTTAATHALGATVNFNVIAIHHNRLKDAIIAIETALGTSGGAASYMQLANTQIATGLKTFSGGVVIENRTDDIGCTQSGRVWLRTDL
jgi:hypothetical protein